MIPSVLDQFQKPPCATLLGFDLIEADPVAGRVRVRFVARPEFYNPTGAIQGGIIAAMLDEAMGPAVLIKAEARLFPSTITMTVTFLAPARPGVLTAEAHVIRLGTSIASVEAELRDEEGVPVARSSASVRLTAIEKAARRNAPRPDEATGQAFATGPQGDAP
jgi:uncharacterized protein (TIGR00369 family)